MASDCPEAEWSDLAGLPSDAPKWTGRECGSNSYFTSSIGAKCGLSSFKNSLRTHQVGDLQFGVECHLEEPHHHLFPALIPPADRRFGIGIGRIVRGVVK